MIPRQTDSRAFIFSSSHTPRTTSRHGPPFRARDRVPEGWSLGRSAFSAPRSATASRTLPARRTPRTLALQRRSPASCLAGLLFTGPSPPLVVKEEWLPRQDSNLRPAG